MRNVLFFGDSNTYGFDPESRAAGTGERFPAAVRWCGVTAHELGSSWHVIEEGLNGRTTVHEDPYRLTTHLSGGALLPTLLKSHLPLDVVVIMLGTNDLKPVYSLGLADIARGMAVLAEAVREFPWPSCAPCPQILLVSPPPLTDAATCGLLAEFDARGVALSKQLADAYAGVAELEGCDFLDAGKVTKVGDFDGVHLDAAGHHALGLAVAAKVQEMADR